MDMGSPAWLTPPVQLHGSRAFECGEKTPEECAYYQERWHFWYETHDTQSAFVLDTNSIAIGTLPIMYMRFRL